MRTFTAGPAASLALSLAVLGGAARAQVPYHRMNEVADPGLNELYEERAKKVPGVYSGRREETDPEVEKDPFRRDLGTLVLHLADIITDLEDRQQDIPGVDSFVKNRLEPYLQTYNDYHYGEKILPNTMEGRLHLKYAHDDLLRMIRPLLRAAKTMRESYDVLRAVREQSDPYLPSLEDASAAMRRTVEEMKPDDQPPDSTGQDVDLSRLYQIQDMARYLEPLRERMEEAAQLVSDAKSAIDSADFRTMDVQRHTDEARKLDAEPIQRLAGSGVQAGSRDYQEPLQSHKVLNHALVKLRMIVRKAREVHQLLERQTKPDEPGLRKTLEETIKADEEIQTAKERSLQAGEKVTQAHRRIRDEIKPAWLQAPPDRRPDLQDQARAAKESSQEASTGARKAVDKAKEEDGKARESFKKLKEDMEKLKETLGERREEDFTEIGMLYVNVKAVRKPQDLPRRGLQNHKSRPMRMPQDLSRSADEIHGMMEGRPLGQH